MKLAYMMQAKRLRGRIFYDKALIKAQCKKRPDLICNNRKQIDVKNENSFCDLSFSFIRHRHRLDQGTLSESIEFNISNSVQKKECRQPVVFDHTYFLKLINSKNEALRKMHLVKLARSIRCASQAGATGRI